MSGGLNLPKMKYKDKEMMARSLKFFIEKGWTGTPEDQAAVLVAKAISILTEGLETDQIKVLWCIKEGPGAARSLRTISEYCDLSFDRTKTTLYALEARELIEVKPVGDVTAGFITSKGISVLAALDRIIK